MTPLVRSVLVYYGVALGLAILVAVLMWVNGWSVMSGPGGALVIFTMWAPALARWVTTRTVDRDWESPLPVRRWGRPRGWVFGWPFACVLAIYAAAYAVGMVVGWADWAPHWGGPGRVAINLVFNVPVGIALGLFGAIGEELGWRGYLQPRLDQEGVRWSVPIVVALELIFHLPIIVLGGYLATDGSLWVIPLFLLAKLGASFVWAHACYAMASIWPAFWFHAIHNNLSQAIFPKLFSGGDDHLRIGESGLLPTLAYLTVAGCILLRMHRRGTRWAQLAAPVVGGST